MTLRYQQAEKDDAVCTSHLSLYSAKQPLSHKAPEDSLKHHNITFAHLNQDNISLRILNLQIKLLHIFSKLDGARRKKLFLNVGQCHLTEQHWHATGSAKVKSSRLFVQL